MEATQATPTERLLEIVELFPKAKILVVGDFVLDEYVWGSVSRISPEAPVPVVNVKRESFLPGGSLNVANNIRTLGGTVYPCGILGRDLEGRMLFRKIRAEGVDTGGIIRDRSRPTTIKTRVIAHSQQVVRVDREKVEPISRKDAQKIIQFIRRKIKEIDAIIVEDYGKGVIEPWLLKPLLTLAKKNKKPILVDPKEKHFELYKGVTMITPNRHEAYGAFGGQNGRERNLEKVGRELLKKLQSKAALVTLGEEGMALFEKNRATVKIPTMAREVYDVSGAGDTVIAVLTLGVACGATFQEAAVLANAAAGIVVGKLGTATVEPWELKRTIVSQENLFHA